MSKTTPKTETKALAPIEEVRGTLARMEPQFKAGLPSHIPVDKFVRVLQTAVNNAPNLVKANRQSLLGAAMKAAQAGLLPDNREAALVTFKDEVVFMPMVQGILKQMRNSGEIASLTAKVVCENDFFEYWIDELGEHLKHKPKLTNAGAITHAYAIGRTKDGGIYITVMNREEIEKVRSVSRSKDSGPWRDWYDQMAIKTVIRRHAKIMPSSTDLDMLIHADDEVFQPPADEPATPKEPKKKSSRLHQSMGIEKQGDARDVHETPQAADNTPESEEATQTDLPI